MTWLQTHLVDVQHWAQNHPTLGWWILGLSLLVSLGGVLAVRWMVLAIPHDYFNAPPHHGWRDRHPLVRYSLKVLKNAIGLVLLVLGLVMLVAPGPGIVTLLLAVIFLDLPGKRALERRIVTLPSVLHVINHMRRRANIPPVDAPAEG
jgi:hypothetical protein